jgi:hypothetical protein
MQPERFERVNIADIRLLVASLYESHPRTWRRNRWECPNCKTENHREEKGCACGISRDGLPEFCERLT